MLNRLLNFALFAMLFALAMGNVQAQYVSPDCPTASAGNPVGPVNTTIASGGMSEAATVIPSTGLTSYGFIVTNPPSMGSTVLGISDNGVYDFAGKPDGEYGFTGITYNNSELETVAGLVCALPVSFLVSTFGVTQETAEQIKIFICGSLTSTTPEPVTLTKLFGLLDLLSDSASNIDSVAAQLNTIAGNALVTVCYATTVSPVYTITVGNVGVEGINGFDNISVLPTLATDQVTVRGNLRKAQALTMELSDLTGRRLATYTQQGAVGSFNYDIQLDNSIPKGYLLLSIRSSEGIYTAKLLRQ